MSALLKMFFLSPVVSVELGICSLPSYYHQFLFYFMYFFIEKEELIQNLLAQVVEQFSR